MNQNKLVKMFDMLMFIVLFQVNKFLTVQFLIDKSESWVKLNSYIICLKSGIFSVD